MRTVETYNYKYKENKEHSENSEKGREQGRRILKGKKERNTPY